VEKGMKQKAASLVVGNVLSPKVTNGNTLNGQYSKEYSYEGACRKASEKVSWIMVFKGVELNAFKYAQKMALILAFLSNHWMNFSSNNSNRSAEFLLVGLIWGVACLSGVDMVGVSVKRQILGHFY
jgi:hypothetical protein